MSDAAIVLHRFVADLVPAIDKGLAAGVLTESGTGLTSRHPLIRTALKISNGGCYRRADSRAARVAAERHLRNLPPAVVVPAAALRF